MKLIAKNVVAEFVNSDEDYSIRKLMGAVSLIYGTSRKKNCKAIAFKNTDMVREVANNLLMIAEYVDKLKVKKGKVDEQKLATNRIVPQEKEESINEEGQTH